MLPLTAVELFLGAIPEGVLFILGNYVFSGTSIDRRRLLISGLLMGIGTYLVRLLPIYLGVHMIIALFILIFLSVFVNKIKILWATSATLVSFVLRLICEWINLLFIVKVFNVSTDVLNGKPMLKVVYGTPSLLLFAAIIYLFYITTRRSKKKRV